MTRTGSRALAEGPGLYVVATPIGNLGDITLRAIEVLRDATVVVAEDTRRARALLSHLDISSKELLRIDASASAHDLGRVVERLVGGASVALVTDAGTPVVSDPGSALVSLARAAGVRVVPIPGASALTAALSVSGYATQIHRFIGFLPRGGTQRVEAIAAIAKDPDLVVLFESPQRVAATLADLAVSMPERRALIAREITKLHEELLEGILGDLARDAAAREWLGELTIVIGPGSSEKGPIDLASVDARIDSLLASGRRPKEAAEIIALETRMPKSEAYDRVNARKRERG